MLVRSFSSCVRRFSGCTVRRFAASAAGASAQQEALFTHMKQREAVAASYVQDVPGAVDGQKLELLFSIDDKPGSLTDVLSLFARHGINLSHIESRPTKTR